VDEPLSRRVFITVAEVSGDNNAARFAAALRQLDPTIEIEGFGGPAMAAAGVKIHFETTRRAAMTLHAVGRAGEVWRWLKWMKAEYARRPPDLHVCVDSSGFNLHFAKVAKSFGVPVLYYVAPQLWASREGRIKQLRAHVDRLACIFPFEEQWFRDRGVNATFVGHPLFDALPANRLELSATPPRFPDRPPVIGILAGSRRSEVEANIHGLLVVAEVIGECFQGTRCLIPTTPAGHEYVRDEIGHWDVDATVEVNAVDRFIPQCDLCLVKSGTSTVHVAAYAVPMIVVYRASPILWHLLGRWLVKTKMIAMVNILAGQTELVPEFIPWHGTHEPVADCAIDLLNHPEKLADQRRKLIELMEPLAEGGASMNVARMALDMIPR
jgi:lipid-A-disaccharide synthase